jgi:hypothetical protein
MDWIPLPPGLKIHARRRIYGFAPGALYHAPIPVPFSTTQPGLVLAIGWCPATVWHKRKTPNGFGGLDPWRWAILESVRAPHGKHLPIPKPHKPTKNIGGMIHALRFSNSCHTVSKIDSAAMGFACQHPQNDQVRPPVSA